MMQTVLTILNSVRKRCNLPVFSTLVGSTDPDELQFIEILYAVCEELRHSRAFPQQKRVHSFATVSNTASYQLPKDFFSPLLNTHFNQSEGLPMVGPQSDGAFSWMLYGDDPSLDNYSFRTFGFDQNPNSAGGQFQVNPTPSSVQTLSFEYISRNLFIPKHWLPTTAYTSGVYVNANGNIYLCDTNGTSGSTAPAAQTANITDGTTRWDYVSDPYETITSELDLCIFDADLVKLGVRAKWMEESGGDYSAAAYEYQSKIDQAVARITGPRIGNMSGEVTRPRYRVPYRSWSI